MVLTGPTPVAEQDLILMFGTIWMVFNEAQTTSWRYRHLNPTGLRLRIGKGLGHCNQMAGVTCCGSFRFCGFTGHFVTCF